MRFVQYILGFSAADLPKTNVLQLSDGRYVLRCPGHFWEIVAWGTRAVIEACVHCKVRRVTECGSEIPCATCGSRLIDRFMDDMPNRVDNDNAKGYICVNDTCKGKRIPGTVVYHVYKIP